MKIYHVNQKAQIRYKIIGVVVVIISCITLLICNSYDNVTWRIQFFFMVVSVSTLFVLRNKNEKIYLENNLLVYDNGLLCKTVVDINNLQEIRYADGMRTFFYMRNGEKRSIPNLFDDLLEIFEYIKTYNQNVEFNKIVPSKFLGK